MVGTRLFSQQQQQFMQGHQQQQLTATNLDLHYLDTGMDMCTLSWSYIHVVFTYYALGLHIMYSSQYVPVSQANADVNLYTACDMSF